MICDYCKKDAPNLHDVRETEVDLGEDGKPVAARTVAIKKACPDCAAEMGGR